MRVVLVDDEPLLRQSLAMIISAEPDLAVVGEAGDGVEAVATARATAPDVVIMDVRMPRLDGIEATRGICRLSELAHTRVLVLSMFDLDEYVFHALRAGASGFLLKDSRPDDLLNAIRRTHSGESLFAPSILARLVEHYVYRRHTVAAGSAQSRLDQLTAREAEVLGLIGQGLSNDEIAAHLSIAVKTVKSHISHLLSKLAARDRVQLVIAAYDAGLVNPASPPAPDQRP
ncbi:response regulator transcription factor [Micromonospora sp. KC606]|uniref:response regulator transcription factor n=1 Tax=Micromonospora sp. KC606 TaxID=2530379 RepID=UPI002442A732|nr:response regulator transcription factor [Micromonospora sp. KC606]